MKLRTHKICGNNKISNCVQIMDMYLYNKLRIDNLQRIIKEIRENIRDKNFVYVYGYKYKNKQGWCGVITDEKYTKQQLINYYDYLRINYRNVTIFTLKGELL